MCKKIDVVLYGSLMCVRECGECGGRVCVRVQGEGVWEGAVGGYVGECGGRVCVKVLWEGVWESAGRGCVRESAVGGCVWEKGNKDDIRYAHGNLYLRIFNGCVYPELT